MIHEEILKHGYLNVRTLSNGVTAALYPSMLFGAGRICFDIREHGYETHTNFESFIAASVLFSSGDDSELIELYEQSL